MSEQAIAQAKPQSIQTTLTSVSHGILQRCSNGVECAECRKKRESNLQRAAVSAAPTNGVPPIVHDVLRSPGQPLDAGTRTFMESRFSHDFSGVRVHTDAKAAESARSVNALAYTVGRDLVFGMGQYSPTTMIGRRLLAHELTHVVQQSSQHIAPNPDLTIGSGDDSVEQEAKRIGNLIGSYTMFGVEANKPETTVGWQQTTPTVKLFNAPNRIQRFAACGASKDCPARQHGELEKARSGPMKVNIIDSPFQGLLISNFDSGSAEVKKDLMSNSEWKTLSYRMSADVDRRWRILGFSDCHGVDRENELLRSKRAFAINNLLPRDAQKQVDGVEPAPLSVCVDDNKTENGRRNNRSVVILQTIALVVFGPEACFDGSQVVVHKGGKRHSCPALTDTGTGATPSGIYCIRNQGEAQRWGLLDDRTKWYLLEPQFPMTRFRMHLHSGSRSAGCVTVTDKKCFDQLAAILNSPGSVSADGYDGYPPGNTAGKGGSEVKNPKRTVSCVGWLIVTSKGGCTP